MTDEEALKRFEKQLNAALVVLESGFGTREGECNLLYRNRKETAKVAISAICERIERNNPQPLTLDELRQMDGEPVWIKHMIPRFTRWYIWDNALVDDTHDGFEGYGEIWVAYRTKPEQSE